MKNSLTFLALILALGAWKPALADDTMVLRRSCVGDDYEAMRGPVDDFREAVKDESPFQVSIEILPKADKYDRKEVMAANAKFQRTVRGNPHIKLTRNFARKGFQPYVYAMVDEQGFDTLLKNMRVCGLRSVN